MREIVAGVYQIEGLGVANVYLLASDGGFTLVDSGTSGDADKIVAQLEAGGYALADLETIVLTHAHGDHVGSAAELVRRSGAQVVAHADEVAYIEGSAPLPSRGVLQRLMNSVTDLFMGAETCPVDRPLQNGEMLEVLGGLRVVHAPGHTPGCIVLYQPEQRLLFCGDVFFHGGPMGRGDGVGLPPRIVSVDVEQAAASARQVAELPVDVVCFGHGAPIVEGAQDRLREALEA